MKKITREFHQADRYVYDRLCSTKKGFAQIDTPQDAWYFGMWCNPFKRIVFSYIEGDCITVTVDTDKEFVKELRELWEYEKAQGYTTCGIDPGFNQELKDKFIALGLSDMLH
jgi:rubredoxin